MWVASKIEKISVTDDIKLLIADQGTINDRFGKTLAGNNNLRDTEMHSHWQIIP